MYAHLFKGAPFGNKNAAGPHKGGANLPPHLRELAKKFPDPFRVTDVTPKGYGPDNPSAHAEKLADAYRMGKEAYIAGKPAAPVLNKEFVDTHMTGAKVGGAIPYLKAYHRGWSTANSSLFP